MYKPPRIAPVIYSFASLTLSSIVFPIAIPQAIAEDKVQPVPCVFGLSRRGDVKKDSFLFFFSIQYK